MSQKVDEVTNKSPMEKKPFTFSLNRRMVAMVPIPPDAYFVSIANIAYLHMSVRERERKKWNKSSKDRTWSAEPDALLGVIS